MNRRSFSILMIAPTPFFSDRGTHIRILEEALALSRRGHRVTIATYHVGQNLPPEMAARIEVRRILRLLFWYKKLEAGPDWQKLILDLMLIRKTFFLARTQRPDIIHGHLHEGALIGWIVQKLLFWRGMRLVADFHGSLTREMVSHAYLSAGFLRRLFTWMERRIDRLGDGAVASSWDNAEDISRVRGSCQLLLDGVNLEYYHSVSRETRAKLRTRFGLPQDKILITYTGALIANKGIRLLLEALPLVVQAEPEAHFVVAGFPFDQVAADLEPWILAGTVSIISPLSYFDLPGLLLASDLAVDPKAATTKQASGKMLQYMGAGLAIACLPTQNNRAYLGDDYPCAADQSPRALADHILALVHDPGLRQRLGERNRVRAQTFSWDKTGEGLEEVYQGCSQTYETPSH